MNEPNIAFVTRCLTLKEIFISVEKFIECDVSGGILVLLFNSYADEDLENVLKKRNVSIIFTKEKELNFSLRANLSEISSSIQLVVFWPRKAKFCGKLGLSRAIQLMDLTGADIICGLTRYQGEWISESGNIYCLNDNQSLVITQSEYEDYYWNAFGPHSYTSVMTGGSLLVVKFNILPEVMPLMAEKISWVILLQLANINYESFSIVLYTGFQAITDLAQNERIDPQEKDLCLIYKFLKRHRLMELVMFGEYKLIIDEDYRTSIYQKIGILDPEGNFSHLLNVSDYYRNPVNFFITGPLYNFDDDRDPKLIEKWKLKKTKSDLQAKINELSKKLSSSLAEGKSIQNTPTKILLVVIMKRIFIKSLSLVSSK